MKKLPSYILISICLLVLGSSLLSGKSVEFEAKKNFVSDFYEYADKYTTENLRSIPLLNDIAPTITFLAGNIRRNGVYVGDEYLLADISDNNPLETEQTVNSLYNRIADIHPHTYFMIIPTSTAIKQEEINVQSTRLFNEREFINNVYENISDIASTIDVYSPLFSSREQYTYYRNDKGLTSLGGYYVYQALVSRLGISPTPLNEFTVRYLPDGYYGELAAAAEYYNLPADTISFYTEATPSTNYSVTHIKDDNTYRRYYTLFPEYISDIELSPNVILGGYSSIIEIDSTQDYYENCLVIGDFTAISYLPFMASHFNRLTFLSYDAPQSIAEQISYDDYDRVVFAMSIESILS